MAKNNTRGGKDRSAFSFGTARDNPLVTAAAVGGAVAAGVFLWSRRIQISEQLSNLSDQISEWRSGNIDSDYEMAGEGDETISSTTGTRSGGRGTTGSPSRRGRARSTPTT